MMNMAGKFLSKELVKNMVKNNKNLNELLTGLNELKRLFEEDYKELKEKWNKPNMYPSNEKLIEMRYYKWLEDSLRCMADTISDVEQICKIKNVNRKADLLSKLLKSVKVRKVKAIHDVIKLHIQKQENKKKQKAKVTSAIERIKLLHDGEIIFWQDYNYWIEFKKDSEKFWFREASNLEWVDVNLNQAKRILEIYVDML